MPIVKEAKKKRLIDSMHGLLAASEDAAAMKAFTEAFYRDAAAEDLVVYSAGELAAFAREAWADFASHPADSHRIRVSNPSFRVDGNRHKAVTIIEIVNDNMPFLVDSVMGELQDAASDILLVLHPMLYVERTAKGKLSACHAQKPANAKAEVHRESVIHIHITRIDEDARTQLSERLDTLMADIRQTVRDWQPMRDRLQSAVDNYKNAALPIPSEELAEAIHFLEWINDDNFTFLGMREYRFVKDELIRQDDSGLGLLANPNLHVLRRGKEFVAMTPEIREFMMRPDPLIVSKANVKSRIHRRVHMDYIGVKLFDAKGKVAGELRIVGLLAATTYTRSTRVIPYVRQKVERIMQRSGFDNQGHSGRALTNVLESYPRDELFQIEEDALYENAKAILNLDERPRVRVLARRDRFDRFVSILTYVPRDRYATEVRLEIGRSLAKAYDGRVSAWYVTYPEGPLVRVHFIVGRDQGETPNPPQEELEAVVSDIIRTWPDTLSSTMLNAFNADHSKVLGHRYADAFQAGYKEGFSAETALEDIITIEQLGPERETAIDFYRRPTDANHRLSLKVYHYQDPIPLSARVPMLENMGFNVINERTFKITPLDGPLAYLHDISLETTNGEALDLSSGLMEQLEALFMSVWGGLAESDGYNALVVSTGLGWRDIAMVRALSRYLRQTGILYSEDYMWGTLARFPLVTAKLVDLFHTRFDPTPSERNLEKEASAIEQAILQQLESVSSLDDDRIIRRFLNIIMAMLRTNFFQPSADGSLNETFSFKFDPQQIEDLPQPRPFREIFVYSPRLEGVHLRFGKVARGGLRWSDRPQDFRTEVLGLVKAQQVKNAVIVPVGAKGGFVPKHLPVDGSREEIFAEGTAAYKIFINALLDVTDNLDGDAIIAPRDVRRLDGDDPYLVVAADKGTATFSDTANAISEGRDFWLGDAFASGGSAGYDHKKMGITARGGWEAVKRHFREMDKDIQSEPFTVAGVGDMSGDVFGNGMLLSKSIRLIAAFDHRDIFIDPDPDPASSWVERKRIFDMGRSSWQDYDKSLISKGGGIFPRNAKSIDLSPEIQELLGLKKAKAAPQDIMTAILKTRMDLLWFGGIGTYIRATTETDADAGDRANDSIRITAPELHCKVIGEGANLGLTQKARIEFSQKGGRCNSDAIDNSAGVNSSDVEVNIKIALGAAVRSERLNTPQRNKLLASMTDEVAALVLRNNYLQTLAISLTEQRGMEDFGYQTRMMQQLEAKNLLNRAVEYLPDDVTLAEMEKANEVLTRPEIGVLLAYAKLTLYDALLASDIPDDTYLAKELFRYFPKKMERTYHGEIGSHRLRREIIATRKSVV